MKEESRIRLIKAFTEPKNWKPNIKQIAEETDMSYKTVSLFFQSFKKIDRVKLKVEWISDEELAKVLKTEQSQEGSIWK